MSPNKSLVSEAVLGITKTVSHLSDQVVQLQQIIYEMAKEPSDSDRRLAIQDDEISQLKATIEGMKKNFQSELQREVEAAQQHYSAQAQAWAKNQQKQSEARIDDLESQMAEQLARHDEQLTAFQDENLQLKEKDGEHEALKQDFNQLRQQHDARCTEINHMRQQMAEAEQLFSASQTEHETLLQHHKELQTSSTVDQAGVENLYRQFTQLQQQSRADHDEYERLQVQHATLQEESRVNHEEYERLRVENGMVQRGYENLLRQNEQLRQQYSNDQASKQPQNGSQIEILQILNQGLRDENTHLRQQSRSDPDTYSSLPSTQFFADLLQGSSTALNKSNRGSANNAIKGRKAASSQRQKADTNLEGMLKRLRVNDKKKDKKKDRENDGEAGAGDDANEEMEEEL